MKFIRWILGLAILEVILLVIFFYPFVSVFEWQSPFLMRCFMVLFLACLLCLYRILKGPTGADRVVAIDILGILVVGFCVILSISTGRDWYIDIGIAWALQSFISTLALAKYLEGRTFDE